MVSNINDILTGRTISFQSINPNDEIVWKGTVIGSDMNHKAAGLHGEDIEAYYQSVKRMKPDIGDIEDLNFFLIELEKESNPTNISRIRVFAKEYITTGSLIVYDIASKKQITIWEITDKALNDIIKEIELRGYVVEKNN